MSLYSLYSILFLTFIDVFWGFCFCFVLQRYYFSSILSFSFLRSCSIRSLYLSDGFWRVKTRAILHHEEHFFPRVKWYARELGGVGMSVMSPWQVPLFNIC